MQRKCQRSLVIRVKGFLKSVESVVRTGTGQKKNRNFNYVVSYFTLNLPVFVFIKKPI